MIQRGATDRDAPGAGAEIVMTRFGYEPYQPQLTPTIQANNIWTVEGPEVDYRLGGAVIPCPTRMTVVRLTDATLWLHSPVQHTDDLQQAISMLGSVSALVAPNNYHYLHVGAWATANTSAAVYASAAIVHKINAASTALDPGFVANWRDDIDHITIDLGTFSETIFFHRASQSLIVTDLMQTFEANRVRGFFTRMLLKVGGATGPNAKPSIEIRLAARKHRAALRIGVEKMLLWNPSRVILSHGPCIHDNPIAAIQSAFSWLG
jgi:Domain of unknown function (DUF4336)